jgi:hypothetical protein
VVKTLNLRDLGLPLAEIVATVGKVSSDASPKAEVINRLRPSAFVDD